MTPAEVEHLIHTMAAAWPKSQWEPTTVALWQNNLAKITNTQMAGEAVAVLMETTRFLPHWSEFMAAYRDLMAAERRDSQVVTALPTEQRAPQVDRSGDVFGSLRWLMRQRPKPAAGESEALMTCLIDKWGDFDPQEKWVVKFRRMQADLLLETVGLAIDRWRVCPGWTSFGRLYLECSDRQSLEEFLERRDSPEVPS